MPSRVVYLDMYIMEMIFTHESHQDLYKNQETIYCSNLHVSPFREIVKLKQWGDFESYVYLKCDYPYDTIYICTTVWYYMYVHGWVMTPPPPLFTPSAFFPHSARSMQHVLMNGRQTSTLPELLYNNTSWSLQVVWNLLSDLFTTFR
jgi:hypothetical protein